MAFEYLDRQRQWPWQGLEDTDHGSSAILRYVHVRQIIKALGGTLVDPTWRMACGLDDFAEGRERPCGQWLRAQKDLLHGCHWSRSGWPSKRTRFNPPSG